MSINRGRVGMRSDGDYDYEFFWLQCDNCNNRIFYDDDILSFMEVVELKKTIAKQKGWKCKKYADGWADLCPICSECCE